MVLLHLAHIAAYWVPESARAGMAANVLRWRMDVVMSHAVTLPLSVFVLLLVYGKPTRWLAKFAGPIAATGYLLHAAMASSVDQLVFANPAAFVGYCLGVAVIIALTPRKALVVYAIGGTAFAVGMCWMQPVASLRISGLLNGCTVISVSVALSMLMFTARRRDFIQRLTIDQQRDQLRQLNAELGQRVDAQVAEIVARASEVELLNAQLSAQVRARSGELSIALATLAKQRSDRGPLIAGTVLANRFELGEIIGSGGMGVVYAGVDRSTGAPVAIKVIQATSSSQLDALRRFLSEAATAAAVQHPAVVKMIHVDITDDGLLFQAQEFVAGETLDARVRSVGALPLPIVVRVGAMLADALASAHAKGVIHRDVKPENVMLTSSSPGLKLLDFGLAKLYDEVSRKAHHQTGTGIVVGTPAFMSPEQALGTSELTDRTDIYTCGLGMFVMLVGHHPFEADSARGMMMQQLTVEAPDVHELMPSVPAAISTLVAECLHKAPDQRPTATELARRLNAFATAHGMPPLESLQRALAPKRIDLLSDSDETLTMKREEQLTAV